MFQIILIREKTRGNIKGASLCLPIQFKINMPERFKSFCYN